MAAMLAMETEKRERVLMLWSAALFILTEALRLLQRVVHCYCEDLTCCLCGVCRDYTVCFEGYADGQACEERGRVQHCGWWWCGEFFGRWREMLNYFSEVLDEAFHA
jgi:hypothetical protein